MGTDSTLLYAYLPLRDFFASVQALEKGEGLSLELINLQHAVPERDYLYGLELLREAFAQYEASVGIGPEMSKRAMPFFRENSRQLVGPEVGMYILPLFGNPDLALEGDGPMVRLAFDYGQLADHCLSENLFLFRRKYDRAFCLNNFLNQLGREYDKVFFDEENTGFAADSRFFSLLCNACLEVADPEESGRDEWRLVAFRRPEEVEYRCSGSMITPFTAISVPAGCLCGVTLLSADPLLRGTLVGFLRKAGLPAERLLDLT